MTNPPERSHPEKIGPYSIVEILGEGGMGTVYLAQQHEPLNRRVALKVVKYGMDSQEVLSRFEVERRSLALMSHDNVARVFDAGSTDLGQPYFVMEHVDGQTLTDYCDDHSLSTPQRVGLFMQICSGVHHAHLKGIVHRDLKPSNIIVSVQDGRAVPKIIDFGLAHATDKLELQGSGMTEVGQILGTPEYMSPEQAELGNEDIDARTDVYSLGILLYELLVGRLPLTRDELMSEGLVEGLRKIREDGSPRPSTRLMELGADAEKIVARRKTTMKALTQALRGDLDWILLKALSKERERRYQSAEAMAEDLRRHLDHEPVQARPPSRAYKVQKYVERNRIQVVASFAVLAALAVGGVSYGVENQRALKNGREAIIAQKLAEDRLDLAMNAVESYFTGISEELLLKEEGFAELRANLLNSPIGFYQQLSESLGATAASRADRVRLSRSLFHLGTLTESVGKREDAFRVFGDALELHESLVMEEPDNTELYSDLLRILEQRCRILRSRGMIDEAREVFQSLLIRIDRLGTQRPEIAAWRGNALMELGAIEEAVGSFEEAEAANLKAIETLRNEAPNNLATARALTTVQLRLANLYEVSKDVEQAEAAFRDAHETLRKLLESHPNDRSFVQDAGIAQLGIAKAMTNSGRYDDAVIELQSVIHLRQQLVDERPAVGVYWSELGAARLALGVNYAYATQLDKAEEENRIAGEIYTRLAAKYPSEPSYRENRARSMQNRADLLARQNRHAEGIPLVGQAVADLEHLTEAYPQVLDYRRSLTTACNTQAGLYQATGRLDEAELAYQKTADGLQALHDASPESVMFRSRLSATLFNVAQLAERRHDYEAALIKYDEALGHALPADGSAPEDRLSNLISVRASNGRAEVLGRLDRFEDSLEAWEAAMQRATRASEKVAVQTNRLITYARMGEHEAAVEELEELRKDPASFTTDCLFHGAMVYAQAYSHRQDEESADHAIRWLYDALDEGVFENPHRIASLRADQYLDPLRELPAFEEFLAEFE